MPLSVIPFSPSRSGVQTGVHTSYGLTLQLPFPCPILPRALPTAEPDITVTYGLVPRQLSAPVAQDDSWQAEPNRFLLRAGRWAGRFLVEDGRRITLQRSPEAEDESLGFHFLDSVLAAALRQSGFLVLHANSLVTPAGAVAICGASGAGKSTTLAILLRRGCGMLADDMTALRLTGDGSVEALPGIPQFALCEDAASTLGQKAAGLRRPQQQRQKIVVPAADVMARTAAPLKAIYLLRSHSGARLQVRSLHGTEKFSALQESIYGPLLPQEHPSHFPLFAAVARDIPVFRLERPEKLWTADAIADLVLHG